MVRDLGGTTDRVERFMWRTLSEVGWDTVVQRCYRAYMDWETKLMWYIKDKELGISDEAMKAKVEVRDQFKKFELIEHAHREIEV